MCKERVTVTVRNILFDQGSQSDARPARPGESRFEFLNRSASAYFAYVRSFIEDWLSHVPAQARADLIGRLKRDDRQHKAAFWELYLHEGYRRSGFSLTIHPPVPNSDNRPDFLLTKGDERFYLEAVTVGEPDAQIAEDQRLQQVYRVLSELRVRDFSLGMEHLAIGSRPLATKRLRSTLVAWLESLDPDAAVEQMHRADTVGFDRVPQMSWDDDDWRLMFQAFPLVERARGTPRRALGVMGPGEGAIVDNVTGIRRVLGAKYGRYRKLDAPLVIAVQSNTEFPTDDYEVERVLFGLTDRRPFDPLVRQGRFVEDGFWLSRHGWERSDCPQVVTIYDLAPWTVPRALPRLWRTLEPEVRGPRQPEWIRKMIIGADAQPADGPDLGKYFGLEDAILGGDPDFELD